MLYVAFGGSNLGDVCLQAQAHCIFCFIDDLMCSFSNICILYCFGVLHFLILAATLNIRVILLGLANCHLSPCEFFHLLLLYDIIEHPHEQHLGLLEMVSQKCLYSV